MRIASLSLLTVCGLLLAVSPAMADTIDLYDNGPPNGTNDAWTINFGFSVSDSFNVGADPHIRNLSFVYWDASAAAPGGDTLTTVDVALGSTSFGGTPQTMTGITNTFLGTNQFGFSLFQADVPLGDTGWVGAGFITLSNACTTSGCSVSTPIYWDENSGVNCGGTQPPSGGLNCPSTAYENTLGSIPSEAFTLSGTKDTTTPEPSSIMLFGSGLLGVFGVLRRKLIG
jgi:PEP-CTERM motif